MIGRSTLTFHLTGAVVPLDDLERTVHDERCRKVALLLSVEGGELRDDGARAVICVDGCPVEDVSDGVLEAGYYPTDDELIAMIFERETGDDDGE